MSGTRTVDRGNDHTAGTTGTTAEGGFAVSYLRTSLPGGVLTERDGARPRQIRRIVRAQLRHWRLEELVEPAQLVVSELVTNAFQHGWGDEVGIRLSRTARTVRVEVRTSPLPTPRPVTAPAARPVPAPTPRPLPGPTATPPPTATPTAFPNGGPVPYANGGPRPVPAAPRPAAGRARPVVAPPRPAPGAPPTGPPAPRDVPASARAAPPAAREAFARTAPFLPRDPLAERGRGLFLVEALADDWGIRGDGAVVWCTLSSPDGPEELERGAGEATGRAIGAASRP
ncbi:ATP-binding protein [Streptomyces sp. NPDC059578]|uniref:ATP-binding protein n=1 Tax=Streptomyces sp. NPDC059578 TaxID=3346874 RepID=UPI00368FBF90